MFVIALRRFWALALLVTVSSSVVVGAYAARLEPTYTASSVVTVEPRSDAPGSAALFTLLATKYVAYAAGDSLAASLARDYEVSQSVVQDGLEVSLQQRTTNINIAMTAADPVVAEQLAGAVSDMLENRASGDPSLQAQIVVPASETNLVTRSGRLRVIGGGVMASLGAGILVAMAANRLLASPRRSARAS